MILQIALLVLGFLLLIKGADWFIKGASALGRKFNISDLAIGLTIVAFGTSAPELVVNSFAAFQNHSDMVFGNVIGSNLINLFVILGIAGLISPMVVQSSTAWKEIPMSFIAVIIIFLLTNNFFVSDTKVLSRIDGLILLFLFALFLWYVYKQLKTDTAEIPVEVKSLSTPKIWVYLIVGMAGLILGGKMVVNNASTIATAFGVSEKIIGLTIVALGTSLPELATSVIAALKKNNDIAVGNIIGSNIFNLFLILPVSSLIRPMAYDASFNTDLYLLAGGTLFLLLAMFTGGTKKLDRWEAGLLLICYLIYSTLLIWQEMQ